MSNTYRALDQDDRVNAGRPQLLEDGTSKQIPEQVQSKFRGRQKDQVIQLVRLNPDGTSLIDEGSTNNTWVPPPMKRGISAPRKLPRELSFWWWEAISIVVTALSLLAIVLTLRLYQDQPLPDWPYDISINTLVSLFVVFMKGSIAVILTSGIGQLKFDWFKKAPKPLSHIAAFDEASRGPLGAIRLMYTSRNQHLLSTLGALITLTGLLLDPFTQQLIRYEGCYRPNNNSVAELPRAHLFNEAQGPEHASPGMIAAINTGLFYPGQYRYPFTCSTGNCTLPPSYYSVAFCNTCKNMHDEIQILTSPPELYSGPYTYTVWTNTTLPSGLTASWNAVNGSSLLFLSAPNNTDKLTVEMILNKGASPSIGREYGEFDSCSINPQSTDWGCLGYGGSSCSVVPCIRVYSGDISAGNLTERTTSFVDTWGATKIDDTYYLSVVDMQCLDTSARSRVLDLISANTTQQNQQLLPIQVAVNPNTSIVQADSSLQHATEISGLIPKQCIYQMAKEVSDDVLNYLGQYLQGNVSIDGKTIVYGKSDGTDILQYFYNSGKITFDHVQDYFNSMTLSMTNYIRQNGNASNNDSVIGTAMETMTCVHVRWPWIIYPTTVVLLTLCFFFCLMISVHRGSSEDEPLRGGARNLPSPQHDFKSAILPLMFHGFDDPSSGAMHDVGHSSRVADLQHDAERLRAQLVMTEKGWKFVAREQTKDK